MLTHIDLDEKLVAETMKLSGITKKKELVNAALHQYNRLLKRRGMLRLQGKVRWEGDLKKSRQ